MKFIETALPGPLIIEPKVFRDERGYFYEAYNRSRFAEHGLDVQFAQTNVSRSTRGVLRGLHYQHPNPQGKLVSVLEGEVYDVAVDIRQGSPSFGKWIGAMLTAENQRHFWVPEGFAHGFCVLSDFATFTYQCTAPYDPTCDAAILWNDPRIGIDWPIDRAQLSSKDAKAPLLEDVSADRLPTFSL
jgi:dTDP-4-dehydrorhamnose 3,5-epimerase